MMTSKKNNDGYEYSLGLLNDMKWNLASILALITTIILVRPGLALLLAILAGYNIIMGVWKKAKPLMILRNIILTVLVVLVIRIINDSLGRASAVWSFVIVVLLLVAYKLVLGRAQLVEAWRKIETMLFGDPLESKYWKDKGRKPTWRR